LWRVQDIDPGFTAGDVLVLRTALPVPKYAKVASRESFYGRVLAGVRALPGVSAAAYITSVPMLWRGGIWQVTLEHERPDPAQSRVASLRFTTPGFFNVLDIPLLEGRDVRESDNQQSSFVAVVSESFARQAWPGQSAIGRTIQLAFRERTIVGVVGDIKVRGLEQQSEPQIYVPSSQVPDGEIVFYSPKELIIRSPVPAATLAAAVRPIVARADPELPVSDVQTLEAVIAAETAPRRVQVRVLGAFAAVALFLTIVGIHGLLAFSVSSRSREIGVRMALGASSRRVLGMVLRQVLVLSTVGVALGVGLALAAGRALQALLAGISPADLATFGAATAACLVMALVSSILPAWRAVRVDPVTAIRTE
jgi:predicted permease